MPTRPFFPSSLTQNNHRFYFDGCDLNYLAEKYGTPLYVYSLTELRRCAASWAHEVTATGDRIFYAMKANSSQALLREFVKFGFGFDIVSGGELFRALRAGADPKNIVYSGVGKRTEEIRRAIEAGILCFNVESESELLRINSVAGCLGKVAHVSLRVNPDVDAKTHPYISTGLKNNKFGVAFTDAVRLYKLAASLPYLAVSGIDAHIGSQLTEREPFIHALEKILDIVDDLKREGIRLDHIDVGGGLGICYTNEVPPEVSTLVQSLRETLNRRGYSATPLFFEPGRSLVASSGILLTRVEYLKKTDVKNFCIVDGSMTEIIRPALYHAEMPLFNCRVRNDSSLLWDVVGPVCESSDWLAKNLSLSVSEGDVLAMPNAGAYGAAMASTYNSRPTPAEVLLLNGKDKLIRERSKLSDLTELERPSGEFL